MKVKQAMIWFGRSPIAYEILNWQYLDVHLARLLSTQETQPPMCHTRRWRVVKKAATFCTIWCAGHSKQESSYRSLLFTTGQAIDTIYGGETDDKPQGQRRAAVAVSLVIMAWWCALPTSRKHKPQELPGLPWGADPTPKLLVSLQLLQRFKAVCITLQQHSF